MLDEREPAAGLLAVGERLRSALDELYAYYRRTEGMIDNLLRDEATMSVIGDNFSGYRHYLAAARETLTRGRRSRGRSRTRERAAIGHALAFAAWRSLTGEQGLDDAQAAELMARLVAGAGR